MSFFFRSSRTRTPSEIVRAAKDAIARLDSADRRKAGEELNKSLASMKLILHGGTDNEPTADQVALLAQEIYNTDFLWLSAVNLRKLDFEARKDATIIFNTLLKRQIGTRYPTIDYIKGKEEILVVFLRGYEISAIALNCGVVVRECAKYEALTTIILYSEHFWRLFDYVSASVFDTASDAFSTFRELLTRHKAVVDQFLQQNYDRFFTKYNVLLSSDNYVTKRQSVKLLSEILLDRTHFAIMTRYIESADNLKLIMNLLLQQSVNIKFEAFHVFKIFVANPNKSTAVENILVRNREKLLSFLSTFLEDRKDDDQFKDEKAFLIKQVEAMA